MNIEQQLNLQSLQIAVTNAMNFDSNINSEVEFKLWVQDEGYRLMDKLHHFTDGDKIAESMTDEMFDLIVRLALTFGFNVGYEYATIQGDKGNE